MLNKLISCSGFRQVTRRCFTTNSLVLDKKQFVVVVKDYEDSECLQRRLEIREKHLSKAHDAKDNGTLLAGGAILDDHASGKMKGSVLLVSAGSPEEIETMIKNDPYYKAKVWESWKIHPVKFAIGL
ncbi:hypothetical protein EDC96DRAFT_523005 [Choanephora cucurbitarum]|nr:hypothetical protein EDC96DRAFT_523005 [Choanephora cucurbitarum]